MTMTAQSATVESATELIAANAEPAFIGVEVIALRRSEPFSLTQDFNVAYNDIAAALGITRVELDAFRDAAFAS